MSGKVFPHNEIARLLNITCGEKAGRQEEVIRLFQDIGWFIGPFPGKDVCDIPDSKLFALMDRESQAVDMLCEFLAEEAKREWARRRSTRYPKDYEGFSDGTDTYVGRSKARDQEEVLPVSDEIVEKTLPHLPPIIADMVRVHRLCGVRLQDVINLRGEVTNARSGRWIGTPGTFCRICLSIFDENGFCLGDDDEQDHVSAFLGTNSVYRPCPHCRKKLISKAHTYCQHCEEVLATEEHNNDSVSSDTPKTDTNTKSWFGTKTEYKSEAVVKNMFFSKEEDPYTAVVVEDTATSTTDTYQTKEVLCIPTHLVGKTVITYYSHENGRELVGFEPKM